MGSLIEIVLGIWREITGRNYIVEEYVFITWNHGSTFQKNDSEIIGVYAFA